MDSSEMASLLLEHSLDFVPFIRAVGIEGYFESEYNRMRSAKERWLALPEQKKAEIRERMKNVRNNSTA